MHLSSPGLALPSHQVLNHWFRPSLTISTTPLKTLSRQEANKILVDQAVSFEAGGTDHSRQKILPVTSCIAN